MTVVSVIITVTTLLCALSNADAFTMYSRSPPIGRMTNLATRPRLLESTNIPLVVNPLKRITSRTMHIMNTRRSATAIMFGEPSLSLLLESFLSEELLLVMRVLKTGSELLRLNLDELRMIMPSSATIAKTPLLELYDTQETVRDYRLWYRVMDGIYKATGALFDHPLTDTASAMEVIESALNEFAQGITIQELKTGYDYIETAEELEARKARTTNENLRNNVLDKMIEMLIPTASKVGVDSEQMLFEENINSLTKFFAATSAIDTIEQLQLLLPNHDVKTATLSELHEMAELTRDYLCKHEIYDSMMVATKNESPNTEEYSYMLPVLERSTNRLKFIQSKLTTIEDEIACREKVNGTAEETLVTGIAREKRENRAMVRAHLAKSLGGALPKPVAHMVHILEFIAAANRNEQKDTL